jgi:hypothetical protein
MVLSFRPVSRHVYSRDGQQGAHDKVRACSSTRDRILPDILRGRIDAEGRICRSGEVVEKLQVQQIEWWKRVGSRCLHGFLLGCHERKIAASAMPDAVSTGWTTFVTLRARMNGCIGRLTACRERVSNTPLSCVFCRWRTPCELLCVSGSRLELSKASSR